MPVLFQFPRSTRTSKARPLHSAMRKSGARSIRRRMKTVHFASTKTLLSAPRTPPTLPLIPYDALGHARSSSSAYPRGPHTPTTPNFSHGSGTTAASSAGPYTPSTPHHSHLSPDLIAYYQPSSSTLKPLPPGVPAKVVHAETVPLDVEWDEAWEWDGGREPPLDPAAVRVESSSSSSMGRRMGRVVRRGREKIPREKLPKTPHPRKAIDVHMPGLSPSIGLSRGEGGGEGGSYFPAGYGYTASEGGHGTEEHRGRERSRRREMLDRLTGRSRSRSQQPTQEYLPAPQPQPHAYAQTQHHHASGGGSGLLQVPQRSRRGSFSSATSGPQQIQLSSSAPVPSPSYKWSNTSTDGRGHGHLTVNYVYPPPPLAVTASPSGQSHHTHTRSRTPSFSTIPRPNTPLSYAQHPQSAPHQQQTHHRHQSASAYPVPPPNVRRRSHSNPPEMRRAYPPPSPIASQHVQHHASANGGGVQSASQFLGIPSRERDGGRKRAGSFSYGAPPPPPSPHPSVSGHRDARPVVLANGNAAHSSSKPHVLRRRTASNPHLPSSAHQYQHQPSSARHRAAPTPHRYLTIPSSSHSHSSDPHISWDVRLPPATATRTRVARGASSAKVHYLSPQALAEPATSPSCASMRVSATRAVQSGRREGWPWPIAIHPQGSSVTLNDVLYSIHTALRARASETEYERLLPDKMDKRAVSAAYEERWRGESRAGGETKKKEVGLRRVDFLRGRTAFVGLEPVGGGEGEWCLVVR